MRTIINRIRKIIPIIILFILCGYTLACAETVNQLRVLYKNDPHGLAKWMKGNITYTKDWDDIHQSPHVTAKTGKADCEDYAILARAVLGKGRLVVENDGHNKHVILVFWHKDIKYVFSNQYLQKSQDYKYGTNKKKFVPDIKNKFKIVGTSAEILKLKREVQRLKDDPFNAGYFRDTEIRKLEGKIYKLQRQLNRV